VKPFDPELLQARIRALLRRAHRPLRPSISWGELQLQPGNPTALLGDQTVELTPKESLILEQLIHAQGGACSKEQLLDGFEDGRRVVGDDALRAHMRNLRHKLSAAGGHVNLIETVYGLGYRLAAP
jgi:DNA-binding response OmpR family regulator